MPMDFYTRRVRLVETDYGRDAGWEVQLGGETIALLVAPRFEDMFWDSYDIDVVTSDPELRRQLQTVLFWQEAPLVWLNREFGDAALYPIPAGRAFTDSGRLMMRGLYLLPDGRPKPWDRLFSWVCRWWRGGSAR